MTTKNKFSFTAAERKQLGRVFKKADTETVGRFLDRCEDVITVWQKKWPAPAKGNAVSKRAKRDKLNHISTLLMKLRSSIYLLPEPTAVAMLVNWNLIKNQETGNCRLAQSDMDTFIIDLQRAIHLVQEDMRGVGGFSKECESELISELGDVYAWTFRQLPSAAPSGIFMQFVAELSNIIKRTDGNPFIASKDIVSKALKSKAKLRSCYLLYRGCN